jgi:dynein heavy chain
MNKFNFVCTDEVKIQLIEIMGDIQDNVNDACVDYFNRFRRQCYVTPKSFLSFIEAYKLLYEENLKNINVLAFRMSNGLNKLVDAAVQVDDLRKVLVKNQENIAIKNVQVEAVSTIFN